MKVVVGLDQVVDVGDDGRCVQAELHRRGGIRRRRGHQVHRGTGDHVCDCVARTRVVDPVDVKLRVLSWLVTCLTRGEGERRVDHRLRAIVVVVVDGQGEVGRVPAGPSDVDLVRIGRPRNARVKAGSGTKPSIVDCVNHTLGGVAACRDADVMLGARDRELEGHGVATIERGGARLNTAHAVLGRKGKRIRSARAT